MDDSKELEKKLSRYLAMPDWPSTWAKIYKDGGMDLIREYCKRLEPEGMDVKTFEQKVIKRYWVGAGQAAESEAEILKIIDGTPVRYRPEILKNPCCTELIVEMLWVGDYVHDDGSPYPELAIGVAYFHHCHKVLAVFIRRPDLRDLPEYVLDLIMAAMDLVGLSLPDNDGNAIEDQCRRNN
jgi:hypothetical protein